MVLLFPNRFSFIVSRLPVRRNKQSGDVLFCVPKENQKSRTEKLGGGEAMKAPAGLLSRRPVCEANAAFQRGKDREARTRDCSPLVTPKKKAPPEKSGGAPVGANAFPIFPAGPILIGVMRIHKDRAQKSTNLLRNNSFFARHPEQHKAHNKQHDQ